MTVSEITVIKGPRICFFILMVLPLLAISGPDIFAAKKLGLKGYIPTRIEFRRQFDSPFLVTLEQAGERHKVRLNNCEDYLNVNVRKHIFDTDSPADCRVLRSQVVPCVAMALLRLATVPMHTALPLDFNAEPQTSNYPATLWLAISDDEIEELSRPGLTLEKATGQPSFRARDTQTMELEAEDTVLRMTLLARGDFDHDGWEDAVFLWKSFLLKGSYVDSKAVVLTRIEAKAVFRQLDVDRLLEGH